MQPTPDFDPLPPDAPRWPLWTEELRLDDALAEKAYEATPPPWRAAIKTGLALAHAHFGQHTGKHRCTAEKSHAGFWSHVEESPAPWAIVAFTPTYAAAARLAAACMPAALAGVPLVAAACVDGLPQKAALVSLELTGIEDIFLLDQEKLCSLLQEMPSRHGRLVLLHAGELAPVHQCARGLGLRCFEESRPPHLRLLHPENFDSGLLAFAQADALHTGAQKNHPPEAVLLAVEHGQHVPGHFCADDGLLTLTPGCEGFWLHPGLDPDFFRLRRHAFGLL